MNHVKDAIHKLGCINDMLLYGYDMNTYVEEALSRAIKQEQKRQVKAKKARRRYMTVFILSALVLLVSVQYLYVGIIIPKQKYKSAQSLMEQEDYSEAIDVLSKLGPYSNSQELILQAKYSMAEEDLEDGDLTGARAIFISISDYKDSKQKVDEIDSTVSEKKYNSAKQYFDLGQYDKAILLFQELGEYKDSADYINSIQDTYQEEFLAVLKKVLAERKKYSVEDTKGSYESLLNLEQPILGYKDINFTDEALTTYKNDYINGLFVQQDSLSYFDVDTESFKNTWQEGYYERMKAVQEIYELGYAPVDATTYKEIVLEELQNNLLKSIANAPVSIDATGDNYVIEDSCENSSKITFHNLKVTCIWNGKYETKQTIEEWKPSQKITYRWTIPVSEFPHENLTVDIRLSDTSAGI